MGRIQFSLGDEEERQAQNFSVLIEIKKMSLPYLSFTGRFIFLSASSIYAILFDMFYLFFNLLDKNKVPFDVFYHDQNIYYYTMIFYTVKGHNMLL